METNTVTIEPSQDDLTARAAREWRKERDRREPLKRVLEAERKAVVRDFIVEALAPTFNELDACLAALDNGDDTGGAYHFRRLVVFIKHAAHGFRDLA
jgi:hypothetical protein